MRWEAKIKQNGLWFTLGTYESRELGHERIERERHFDARAGITHEYAVIPILDSEESDGTERAAEVN